MERSESILSIKTKEHFFTAPVVIVALLLGAVAFWGADKQTLGLFHDDGIYAVVAKALAEGDGYRVVSLPGAPAQTKYPFLFSFLISLLWRTTRGLYGNRVPYSWAGFEETFAWIREHAPGNTVLATACDPMYYLNTGRRAIRPALHRPATYFYPYGNAQADVGTVDEIKPQPVKLRVKYLIIDPLQGYAEAKRA